MLERWIWDRWAQCAAVLEGAAHRINWAARLSAHPVFMLLVGLSEDIPWLGIAALVGQSYNPKPSSFRGSLPLSLDLDGSIFNRR